MTVKEILKQKGTHVETIRPQATVQEAARQLASAAVGTLLVTDEDGTVVGILSERDLVRAAAVDLEHLSTALVGQLMTRGVITGRPEDSMDQVLRLMTDKRIRHLPILDQGLLAGIVSIGDLVKAKMRRVEQEVEVLQGYIAGGYPA